LRLHRQRSTAGDVESVERHGRTIKVYDTLAGGGGAGIRGGRVVMMMSRRRRKVYSKLTQ
jgi:hypothetical protein